MDHANGTEYHFGLDDQKKRIWQQYTSAMTSVRRILEDKYGRSPPSGDFLNGASLHGWQLGSEAKDKGQGDGSGLEEGSDVLADADDDCVVVGLEPVPPWMLTKCKCPAGTPVLKTLFHEEELYRCTQCGKPVDARKNAG